MEKDYISQLTGIRIFLTLLVVLSNLAIFRDVDAVYLLETDWLFLRVLYYAPFRVDVFFMLTGFLLYYMYEKTFSGSITAKDYLRFLSIRIARVYPVHLLTVFLVLVLYALNIWQYQMVDYIADVGTDGSFFLR